LITGGAGFLGSWLSGALIELGVDLVCVDNLSSGSLNNISHLKKSKRFRFLKADVEDLGAPPGSKFRLVLHLASRASPEDYQAHPIEALKANSIGTLKMLEIARKHDSTFLFTSTSEIYGDAEVVPTPEDYWGNVNPIGPRSPYDESKRFSEALCKAYERKQGLDVRVVRIFNSVLGDQPVAVFNDGDFHLVKIGEYVNGLTGQEEIYVPSFDENCRISLRKVSTAIRHPYSGDAYQIETRYGRKVKVTGDHSVFTRDEEGKPVSIPVRRLKVGDYIALPTKLPTIAKDIENVSVSHYLQERGKDLWDYLIISPQLRSAIVEHKKAIMSILRESGRYKYPASQYRKYLLKSQLPIFISAKLRLKVPGDAKIRMNTAGAHIYIPNRIRITDDVLWLIGFYVAEGCAQYKVRKDYFITFSSDQYLLERAKNILENTFQVHVIESPKENERSSSIYVHSKILYFIFDEILKVIKTGGGELRMPPWVFQLPLTRLKHVLEGFREGDGTHSGKKHLEELCFDTVYEGLALDLAMLLLRFGIVASVGRYFTTYKQRYGNRKFEFYRVAICKISNFNILEWDKGVRQELNARKTGDLLWAKIRKISKCQPSKYVYDFSVPETENFVAGNGICCHNTYGPRLRPEGLYGRAVSRFTFQAIQGQDMTVYGDGSQTRSFCYVTDTIRAIILMLTNEKARGEVFNIGNPKEISIIELARKIKTLSKSDSRITFHPLPQDDPRRRCPDISKAKGLLKWEPEVSLDEGLKRTISWFQTILIT